MEKGGGYNCLFVTSSFCFANDLCVCDVQNWCLCRRDIVMGWGLIVIVCICVIVCFLCSVFVFMLTGHWYGEGGWCGQE